MTRSGVRWIVVVLGAAALALQLFLALAEVRTRRELQEFQRSPLAQVFPDAVAQLRRESDPVRRGLITARLWLRVALEPSLLQVLPTSKAMLVAAEVPAWLNRAEATARDALVLRPGSAQAAALAAVAHLVRTSWQPWVPADLESVQRLLAWAMALAPEDGEVRCVAGWAAVSGAFGDKFFGLGREEIIARALELPDCRRSLLEAWRRAAPDFESFLAALPRLSAVYEGVQHIARREQDAVLLCRAWKLSWDVMVEEAEKELALAEALLKGGDRVGGRRRLVALFYRLPVDARLAPLVDRIMTSMPPGSLDQAGSARAKAWLEHALWYHWVGRRLLAPETILRLAGYLRQPEERPLWAAASLAAGNPEPGLRAEAEEVPLATEAWASYVKTKIRWLVDRGETAAARRWVAFLPPMERTLPSAQAAAARGGCEGEGLEQEPHAVMPPTAWRFRQGEPFLELCAFSPGILKLEWTAGPSAAALVAVDGAAVGCVERSPTAKTHIRVPLANGVRRLSVHRLLGEMPLPDVVLEQDALPR